MKTRMTDSIDGMAVDPTPQPSDARLVEETRRGEHASFTGAFVGMLAFDVSGTAMPADFAYFEYRRGV